MNILLERSKKGQVLKRRNIYDQQTQTCMQDSILFSDKLKIKLLYTIFHPSNWETFTKVRTIQHWLGWGEIGLLICLVGIQTSRTFLEIMWNRH